MELRVVLPTGNEELGDQMIVKERLKEASKRRHGAAGPGEETWVNLVIGVFIKLSRCVKKKKGSLLPFSH